MKRTKTHQQHVLDLRNGSRSRPIPAKKVRKQTTRGSKKAAAIREGM